MAITIAVKLFGDIRKYLPGRGVDGMDVVVADDATVADVLAAVGIPADAEFEEGGLTAAVNGDLATRETALHKGDSVVFFSPMSGG